MNCVPSNLSSLTNLQHINFSQNRIKELPYGIRELVNVKYEKKHLREGRER
jgi:Leucine-rich repeat (LRR) protein